MEEAHGPPPNSNSQTGRRRDETTDREASRGGASLREGLEETLTILQFRLPDALERTLSTTNPIENLNGLIRSRTRNVRRWESGTMVL